MKIIRMSQEEWDRLERRHRRRMILFPLVASILGIVCAQILWWAVNR